MKKIGMMKIVLVAVSMGISMLSLTEVARAAKLAAKANFNSDGTLIVTGGGKVIKVWDLDGNMIKEKSGYRRTINAVTFSPDSQLVASGSDDGVVRVWNLLTDEVREFKGHNREVNAVDFSSDGTLLVSASFDNTVRIWNVASGNCLHELTGHTAFVWDALVSPDDSLVGSVSFDSTAKLWDVESGECVHTLTEHVDTNVVSIAFNLFGNFAVTGAKDAKAIVWDVATGLSLKTLVHGENNVTSRVTRAVFSPDSQLVATGSKDGLVKVWYWTTNNDPMVLIGHTNITQDVNFSPDGNKIVTSSYDGLAKIWLTATGEWLKDLAGHTDAVVFGVFRPQGDLILTAGWDGTARLWDATNGTLLYTMSVS